MHHGPTRYLLTFAINTMLETKNVTPIGVQSKANRQAAQKFILDVLEEIIPGGVNQEVYTKIFDRLTDEEFAQWMTKLAQGTERVVVYAPNFADNSLDVQRNIKVARERFNHEFWQRLWKHPKNKSEPSYLTNNPFMVVELPVRRQAQLLEEKISVPEHSRSIDAMTGQPSGDSRNARISFPELLVLRSMGMDQSLQELVKYRGGDIGGFNAYTKAMSARGGADMNSLKDFATGVESTNTLYSYLMAMHLRNTLA